MRVLLSLALLLVASSSQASAPFLCPTAQFGMNDTLPEYYPPEPAQFATFVDSIYGTCLTRITNAAPAQSMVPVYSQLQAFNADNTKILLKDGEIINVGTWTLFKNWPYNAHGARWSPTDPNRIFYISGASFKSRNIVTDVETTHRNFTEYPGGLSIENTWEEMSADGRTVALIGFKGAFEIYTNADVFVYDVIANRKGTVMPASRVNPPDCGGADAVGMSPSGRYILVQWGEPNSTIWCGLQAYDTSMVYQGQVGCGGGHYDLTMDADSTEWAVFFSTGSGCSVAGDGSWDAAYLVKSKIPNGRTLYVSDPVTHADKMVKISRWSDFLGGGHVSGQAHGVGWVLASADSKVGSDIPRMPYENELIKIYLDSTIDNPHIERLTDTRSRAVRAEENCSGYSSYWAEPHASMSRDGTMVIWGSGWGSTWGPAATDCKANTYIMNISNKGFNAALVNQTPNTWVKLSPTVKNYDGSAGIGFVQNPYSGGVFADQWGSMLLFGGGDHSARLGNDVWIYDTQRNTFWQWTYPDSKRTYPTYTPNRESFRSYTNLGLAIPFRDSDSPAYITHTYLPGGVRLAVSDPIVPKSPWVLGTTSNLNPWSSHSYDQLAWNFNSRKMLYWGPNFCSGLCMGAAQAMPESVNAGMSQSALYFGTKSAHLFSPYSKRWENFSGNMAPDLVHQGGSTAYDPVTKKMLAVNKTPWVSSGGSISDGRGRYVVQGSDGVWSAPKLMPNQGTWWSQPWVNITLTYVRSTGTFYTWYKGQIAEYNPTSDTWSQVPTNPDPVYGNPPDGQPYVVYDPKSNKLLIRGRREGSSFTPTWTFDINTRTYQKMNPPVEPGDVSGDWFMPTVYDPTNNVFLMTRLATSGAAGIGDPAAIGGGLGEIWSYKLTAGSGSGVTIIPTVPNPCSSNP